MDEIIFNLEMEKIFRNPVANACRRVKPIGKYFSLKRYEHKLIARVIKDQIKGLKFRSWIQLDPFSEVMMRMVILFKGLDKMEDWIRKIGKILIRSRSYTVFEYTVFLGISPLLCKNIVLGFWGEFYFFLCFAQL